jgi:NADPH-dependent ferric siderophore reductase
MTSSTATDAPRERGPRPQAVLRVRRREQLSPHMVRIVAGGPASQPSAPSPCCTS